jgi:hypothetical protein
MSKPRWIVALTLGLCLVAPRLAYAGPDGDPTAPEAGVTPDPSATTPIPPPSSTAPPKPAFTGKGLIYSAVAVASFSFVSRMIAMGVGLSLNNASCDPTTSSCDDPIRKAQVVAAFTFMAPISELIATGLVIPGGVLAGRSQGHSFVTTGKPDRNGRALLIAGAVIFGVSTAASVAARPAYVLHCIGDITDCGGRGAYAGYMIGVQVSDMLSTAGAGMMSYGIAYQNYRKTHGPKVALGPWSSRGAYGLSLSGRF